MEHPEQKNIVYEADIETLKSIRERVHAACKQYMHKNVRIQTIDSHIYEGTIVHVDGRQLYLSVPQSMEMERQFFYPFYNPYYSNVILPLVLFDLLTITLLYT